MESLILKEFLVQFLLQFAASDETLTLFDMGFFEPSVGGGGGGQEGPIKTLLILL